MLAVVLFVAVLAAGVAFALRVSTRDTRAAAAASLRVRVLQGAIDEEPDDPATHRLLAFAYQKAGFDREALREYEQILTDDSKDLAALYNCGVLYLQQGADGQGVDALSRVLEIAPTHSLAANALAEHYIDDGDYERALAVILPAADAHPSLADLQYLAGVALENTDRASEAAERYRKAVALVPDMKDAQAGLDRVEAGE